MARGEVGEQDAAAVEELDWPLSASCPDLNWPSRHSSGLWMMLARGEVGEQDVMPVEELEC